MTSEPYAEIERVGRRMYRVSVVDGIARWGPDGYGWLVWGLWARRRAERKAPRVLARYRREQQWRSEKRRVTN